MRFASVAAIANVLALGPSVIAHQTQTDQLPSYQSLPSLREQAQLQDAWVAERQEAIPKLLQKHNVDAWLISQREYAEETVFWSLKTATQFSARRRTTYLYLANTTDDSPTAYSWIDNTPQLWTELTAILDKQQPASIAINADPEISFSSGLHAGELDAITAALGKHWSARFVVKPMLAVEYIGTQIEARLPWYRKMQETAWAIITEGFSEKVITPGETTTADVEWWMRDKIQALNYTTWFQPSVSILDETFPMVQSGGGAASMDRAISHGDMIHVDFGVTAMGMNTDTQHLGYVLHPGDTEDDVPQGLKDGLKKGNRLQEITMQNMKPGLTGDEVLKATRAQMQDEGLEGKIYCHAIGDWGHSAGTVIGMTNLQGGVPVLGELPLLADTWYSVELQADHYVPERNVTLKFPLEEDVYWAATAQGDKARGFQWVYGQQQKFHLVKSSAKKGDEGWAPEDL